MLDGSRRRRATGPADHVQVIADGYCGVAVPGELQLSSRWLEEAERTVGGCHALVDLARWRAVDVSSADQIDVFARDGACVVVASHAQRSPWGLRERTKRAIRGDVGTLDPLQ